MLSGDGALRLGGRDDHDACAKIIALQHRLRS
jgi:hypothetical protein